MADAPERVRVGEHVTIYPRGKKKVWCADFLRDGRHCRQSLHTANKKVALQRAVKLDTELAGGTYRKAPPPLSVEQAAKDYQAFLQTEDRAPKTRVKYRGILKVLIAFLSEQKITCLNQITPATFDRFRALRKVGRKPKTLYCEGVVVKQFLKWCVSRRLLAENPLSDFKLVKPPLEPREAPNLEQVDRILTSLSEPQRTMVALLAFTGMRSGELQRLKPEDIDLVGNWVHVRSRVGLETKTRQSRKVPIHSRLLPLLVALPRRTRPWLFTMPPSKAYPTGNHWVNVKRLNEDFLAAVTSLKLPAGREGGFTLHSLRHSFETITVNAGIPQRVVDTWLGHRSDRSMAAVYYKLKDDESQHFMTKVPLGTSVPAADAGEENAQ
jgi:integrase